MLRHKRLLFTVLVVLLVTAALPLASAQEGEVRTGLRWDAPPFGVRGLNPVGAQMFEIDSAADRVLRTTIWYPALNPEGLEESIVYSLGMEAFAPPLDPLTGHALLDAAPNASGGPYPLVIWSHGHGGSPYYGHTLPEHLASRGFVVIAPEHTGNAIRDTEETINAMWGPMLVLRPLDISAAIDFAAELNETGLMAGMIDLDHVAVIGMSFGGYTALMAGGAQLDLTGFSTWCAEHPELDVLGSCPAILPKAVEMATLLGLDAAPEGLWPNLGDARVDAIVPIVPAGRFIGNEGIKSVNVPTLLLVAGADRVAFPDQNAYPMFDNLAVDKAMVVFENANHFVFGTCSEAWAAAIPFYCTDDVWDVDRAHDIANHLITAFLRAQFFGDEEALAALMPETVLFPGIRYTTTMLPGSTSANLDAEQGAGGFGPHAVNSPDANIEPALMPVKTSSNSPIPNRR